MNLKLMLKNMIFDVLNSLEIEFNYENIVVEVPKVKENGDFSTNIAMQLVKILKDNPNIHVEQVIKLALKML